MGASKNQKAGSFTCLIGKENGSAFVLTLLFLLLLTIMTTGLFLYANKEAAHADANYTSVAAGFIAQAGIERGMAILQNIDLQVNKNILDTDGNGRIEPADYPVMLPGPEQVGMHHGSEGRQGVGYYTASIDLHKADMIEYDMKLTRTQPWQTNVVYPTSIPSGTWNKFLPFKHLNVSILLSSSATAPELYEIIDDFDISMTNSGIRDWQTGLEYRWFFQNVINPFADRRYKFEMNRIPFPAPSLTEEYDFEGKLLYLFPNDLPATVCTNCQDYEFFGDRMNANAFVIDFTTNRGYYLLHIYNEAPAANQPIVTVWYYDMNTGMNVSEVIVNNTDWSAGTHDLYAVLDFQNSLSNWSSQRNLGGPAQHIKQPDLQTGREQLIFDISNTADPSLGYRFDISRGSPMDVMDLNYRIRTETMRSTCPPGQPYTPNPDCCWYPNYPNNCGDLTEYFADLMDLNPSENYKDFGAGGELNSLLNLLNFRTAMQSDEIYTISSTGNVEMANQRRQVLLEPVSYLDFSRYVQESTFLIGPSTVFGGKVYSTGRIRLDGEGDVFFYDDVYTGSNFVDSGYARFRQGAELKTRVPRLTLPDLNSINRLITLANADGWVIPGGFTDYYLFLGNYDYLGQASLPYGFNFLDPTPLDTNQFARYIPPPATLGADENCYSGYVPTGGSTVDLSLVSGDRNTFNGVIVVPGNLHIWGKLRGMSLTIVALGDVILEREVLMGTTWILDDARLEINHPYRDEGEPVHLGLIAARPTNTSVLGDIVISEFCPRIMKIESTLMAPGGVIRTGDALLDFRPPPVSPHPRAWELDADRSHKYYYRHYNTSTNVFEWRSSNHPFGAIDINADGKLETNHYGWNETNVISGNEADPIPAGDPPDNGVYLWYLEIKGPLLTQNPGNVGFFQNRSYRVPGDDKYNEPRIDRSRNFLYDPSIRYNPPPYFPVPVQSLKVLEWSNVVAER